MENGSGEIPDHFRNRIPLGSNFLQISRGGCHSGGGEAPKNVIKRDDFSRAGKIKKMGIIQVLTIL
jgi:hypothetical protein